MASDFRDCVAWRKARELVVKIDRTQKRAPWRRDRDMVSSLRRAAFAVCEAIIQGFSFDEPSQELCEYLDARGQLRVVEGYLDTIGALYPDESDRVDSLLTACDHCAHELGKLIEESQVRVHVQNRTDSLG